jgi:hypothetical protein
MERFLSLVAIESHWDIPPVAWVCKLFLQSLIRSLVIFSSLGANHRISHCFLALKPESGIDTAVLIGENTLSRFSMEAVTSLATSGTRLDQTTTLVQ